MPSFMCMPWACNRQVDSMDRRQCNLQQIPGDIERYARSLEELLLDMNHIHDLPKSLFRLHKLQRLGLSDNDIHRLPPEVSSLHNLVELNLSRNDISDLPEDLKICQNLQLLDISSNPIARLPDSITLCTSLTQLSLNDISLTKLPQDIGKLVLLKSLEVRENHLRALPPSISELSQLQRLDLGQNELDDLPNEIGSLRLLQELYVDENSLERLPDAIIRCTRLEQLDASSNRLFQLPNELGDLGCLADLTISHNCLRELPNSIGRLKRLLILKADDNTIDTLTPAIGGCTALNELYLQQNLISELPSSIGNLRLLQTLNLDRCQLRQLPALIGECQSLAVLSLRDNQVEELPMEIGKLAKLRVLDVCNNRITYLPYTVNVLRELQALWLSENQSQALLRLQPETDPRTGIKVLTCYLLPQHSVETKPNGNGAPPPPTNKAAFVGGPKVHFGGEEEQHEEAAGTSGGASGAAKAQFERKNTPHPKPSVGGGTSSGGATGTAAAAAKHHKKQQVDGHIVHRMGEHPKQILLNSSGKKISQDHSSQHSHSSEPSSSAAISSQPKMPRSALKYSSRAIIQQQQGGQIEKASGQPTKLSPEQSSQNKTVFFATSQVAGGSSTEVAESPGECRLKRVNTPHYKSQRASAGKYSAGPGDTGDGTSGQQQPNRRQLPKTPSNEQMNSTSCNSNNSTRFPPDGMLVQDNPTGKTSGFVSSRTRPESPVEMERKRVIVWRDNTGGSGLGLSIAGGIESTPFIDNDPGLFISKLMPGGAAERAGLQMGDKVLEINGTSMVGRRHQAAVDCIQQRADAVELRIQRQSKAQMRVQHQQPPQHSQPQTSSGTSLHQITAAPSPLLNSSNSIPPIANSLHSLAATTSSIPSTSTPNSTQRPTTPSQLTNTSFSFLPSTTTTKLPYASDLPFGDPKLNGIVEEVDLVRDSKNSLGLSIVGGIDHCSHPFGSSAHPGVFISKITTNSPAEMSRRLRIGDRILKVNDMDITKAKHNEAVEALKKTGRTLRLTICHEQQPRGLRSIVVHRHERQPLGLSICGGIGSNPVNPDDPTDEGIFIERVEKGGPAYQSSVGLTVGMRILEVNDDSLLGCTKEEAAQIFRGASTGPVRMLVCEGFSINNVNRPPIASVTVSTMSPISPPKQQQTSPPSNTVGLGLVNSSSPPIPSTDGQQQKYGQTNGGPEYQNLSYDNQKISTENNKNTGNHMSSTSPIATSQATTPLQETTTGSQIGQQAAGSIPLRLNRTDSIERSGVTTFSTTPTKTNKQPTENNGSSNNDVKIPPPVAPKPKLNITSFSAQSGGIDHPNGFLKEDLNNSTNFSARLRQFEQQQRQPNSIQTPPTKRPLLSHDDLAKLAEDDKMRQRGAVIKQNGESGPPDGISPMSPPTGIGTDDRTNPKPSFEHILNDSPIPPFSQSVSSIRTKKAENRFLQQQRQNAVTSPSTIDQVATEQQRRSEWRQARMASLEAETRQVGQLISDVIDISH